MKLPRRVRGVVVFVTAFLVGTWVAGYFLNAQTEQVTAPTTAPSTQAVIDPAAMPVVNRLAAAYAKRPIRITGSLSIDFDVAEIKQQRTQKLAASVLSPMQFSHDIENELQIVGDGKQITVLDRRSNQYMTRKPDSPEQGIEAQPFLVAMLREQNPGLLLALSDGSTQLLFAGKRVSLVESKDGIDVLAVSDEEITSRWSVKTASGEIERIEMDFKSSLEKQGATQVRRAQSTLQFEPADHSPQLDGAAFAFRAPPDAIEAQEQTPTLGVAEGDLKELVGKPAPAFELADTEGAKVSLESLKGKVVVLDFWATWCGPCAKSLPILNQVAGEFKDKEVVVYPVNLAEDAGAVRSFLQQMHIELRSLLDTQQSVAKEYRVSGIPQAVIIGKDGNVRYADAGVSSEYGAELRRKIQASLE